MIDTLLTARPQQKYQKKEKKIKIKPEHMNETGSS